MNINSLPRQVFGYLCTFIDAKSRSKLNMTCKKFSDWEKDFPFWELMQESQFVQPELLKPIHFSKKFSQIKVSLCEFQNNPSISSCVKLYQNRNNIMIMNKAFEIIKIKPIDIGCLFDVAKSCMSDNKEDLKSGNLKIEETLLKDFFVLYAEIRLSEFCNRETKAALGYRIRAFGGVQEIILIFKDHYNHSYTENCEIFLKELNALGNEYQVNIEFKPN